MPSLGNFQHQIDAKINLLFKNNVEIAEKLLLSSAYDVLSHKRFWHQAKYLFKTTNQ